MEKTPKILAVDDNSANLYALEKVLRCIDIKIVKALNGNDALKAILDNEFAL